MFRLIGSVIPGADDVEVTVSKSVIHLISMDLMCLPNVGVSAKRDNAATHTKVEPADPCKKGFLSKCQEHRDCPLSLSHQIIIGWPTQSPRSPGILS